MTEIPKQPVLNIGMVGHIDHGKTTLLHRLSGKWSDTHSEELKRGITIKLGYSDVVIGKCACGIYTTEKNCKCGEDVKPLRYVSFVDVPGHEMLMATMLSGAAIIDAALLVIAANEPCPKPQTKEHLIALQAKGLKNIIIVQNKVDAVTKEQALKNYQEIKDFIKGTVAESAQIIPVSAKQGINIDAVYKAITDFPIPKRNTSGNPIFFVARSFDVNKPGTKINNLAGAVLGGTLKSGILKIGDEIEIKPGLSSKKHGKVTYKTLKTKIIGLQSGKNKLDEAIPSGSLAIQTSLDPATAKSDALGGCVVGKTGTLPEPKEEIEVKTTLFKEVTGAAKKIEVTPIIIHENLLLSANTSISLGRVTQAKKGKIKMHLRIPLVLLPGSKIGLARSMQGHWRLIGWAEI